MITITKAYKVEISPTPIQREQLERIAAAVRFVYNAALTYRDTRWRMGGGGVGWIDMAAELREMLLSGDLPDELAWLGDVPRESLNAALQNLDRAMTAFFRRVKRGEAPGFPRYKARSRGHGGFKFFSVVTTTEASVRLPKIGTIALREVGYLPVGTRLKIRSGSVTERAVRWYVSVAVNEERPDPVAGTGRLAVHLGAKQLATIHDGQMIETIPNPPQLKQHLDRLARLQRVVARKIEWQTKRRSGRTVERERAQQKVAEQYKRIADIRADAIHRLTTRLTRERRPAELVVETWEFPEGVRRTASGTAWGEIGRQLEYKATWYGVRIIRTPRYFPSSSMCSACGVIAGGSSGQRIFVCAACGHSEDRESNAVRNVFRYSGPSSEESLEPDR